MTASQLAGRLSSTQTRVLHSLLKSCLGSQARGMRGSSPPGCASCPSFCTPLAGRPRAPGRAPSASLPSPPVLLTLLVPGPSRDTLAAPRTVLGGSCPWLCSAVAALRTSPLLIKGPASAIRTGPHGFRSRRCGPDSFPPDLDAPASRGTEDACSRCHLTQTRDNACVRGRGRGSPQTDAVSFPGFSCGPKSGLTALAPEWAMLCMHGVLSAGPRRALQDP